ncbi:MAG: 4Fe-4S dicluster domain-containing protein [Candidatus Moranbacteria bacterium]|nr:4Fe-4S dicluster domain-containing protein [Candidatus Moranbacteria bacterium]
MEENNSNSEKGKKDQSNKVEKTVQYDLDTCTRCMACITSCPTHCLEEVDGDPVQTRPKDCIKCGTCEAICPVGAVKLIK